MCGQGSQAALQLVTLVALAPSTREWFVPNLAYFFISLSHRTSFIQTHSSTETFTLDIIDRYSESTLSVKCDTIVKIYNGKENLELSCTPVSNRDGGTAAELVICIGGAGLSFIVDLIGRREEYKKQYGRSC
eukprot:m.1347995 g.1347995  ORF g.1347995 m.1347995 type:complete len:132 (+) comp24913_c0_seq4:94-489(+)